MNECDACFRPAQCIQETDASPICSDAHLCCRCRGDECEECESPPMTDRKAIQAALETLNDREIDNAIRVCKAESMLQHQLLQPDPMELIREYRNARKTYGNIDAEKEITTQTATRMIHAADNLARKRIALFALLPIESKG